MVDWDLKAKAFISRIPGRVGCSGSELTQLADSSAMGIDYPVENYGASSWGSIDISHPLTLRSVSATDLQGIGWGDVADSISQRYDSISSHYADPKKRYLALWRLFPESCLLPGILENDASIVKRWWKLLPATPETPYLPLWDHLDMVSALLGTEKDGDLKPAILQFNIADTQPFITSARRTQDLWAGSYLVSFLSWQIMLEFVEKYGPDCIIQPKLRSQPMVDLWLRRYLGDELIIPGMDVQGVANIPNIFTVILPESDVEAAANEACARALNKWKAISDSVRTQLSSAASKCGKSNWDGCDEIWDRQIADFLKNNIFWASVPYPAGRMTAGEFEVWVSKHKNILPEYYHSNGVYDLLRKQVDATQNGGSLYGLCSQLTARLLNDRKRFRDFDQIDEPGLKCSLSGTFRAIYPPAEAKDRKQAETAQKWWKDLAGIRDDKHKMAGRIRRGDHLCAVQAVKRLMLQSYFQAEKDENGDFFNNTFEPRIDRHQFPSTAGIANARFIEKAIGIAATDEKAMDYMSEYVQQCRKLMGKARYEASLLPRWQSAVSSNNTSRRVILTMFARQDGEFLYPETYDQERLKREYGDVLSVSEGQLESARKSLSSLLNYLGGNGGSPSRYYAIIAMDGDNMGDLISGRSLNRPIAPAVHKSISNALAGFALHDARRIVETENAGKLIYCGGDDVLALCSVVDLMEIIDNLYECYQGIGKAQADSEGIITIDGTNELRIKGTISAGAVIVHERVPLLYAMEQVRAAEQDAKKKHKRDAFSIRLLRRSGAPLEIGSKWRVNWKNKRISVPQCIMSAASLMRREILSPKLPYDMLELSLLEDGSWDTSEDLDAARSGLFTQLVKRHIPTKEKNNRDVVHFIDLFNHLMQAESFPKDKKDVLPDTEYKEPWISAANLLLLAKALSVEE